MNTQVDIAVYSPTGQLILAVEVKSVTNRSLEWAAQMRQNLLTHGFIPNTAYFLLALPDYLYFWHDADPYEMTMPDHTIKTADAFTLSHYNTKVSLIDISGYGLEILITSWLEYLINTNFTRDDFDEKLHWLFDSGLYSSLKNSVIAAEIPV